MPELQQFARSVTGDRGAGLRRLLVLVCELLKLDLAFVGVLTPYDQRIIRLAVQVDGLDVPGAAGLSEPLARTWCSRVVQDGTLLIADARQHPTLQELPSTSLFGIASYAGVALRDVAGNAFGTLCAVGHDRHKNLDARDRSILIDLGELIGPLVWGLDRPPLPTPRGAPGLGRESEEVGAASQLQQLSRPLLQALHELTGLASVYLTVIHHTEGLQEIRYARNTRAGLEITEGSFVPWADTLCKRALAERRACTTDVPGIWGDSEAAAALGIEVYVSVPIELPDGQLWGTLCAVDTVPAVDIDKHLPAMRVFARLIAAEAERDCVRARALPFLGSPTGRGSV